MHAVSVRAGITIFAMFCALTGGTFQQAHGGLFTLTDGNSSATVNTGSQAGMSSWLVSGEDQMYQQWFWYRIGNTAESSLDTLKIVTEGTSDLNFNGDADALFVRYQGAGFYLDLRYSLHGGTAASRTSDMAEQISITNESNGPLDFHFFQYSDFDLGPGPGGETAVFTNLNAVRQQEGGSILTETVITPVASHREIDFYNNTLTALNDGVATTLSDTPIGLVVGPGDMTWAYQWDVLIPRGGTFQISKDKNLYVIPEPSTLALASLAALGLLVVRRRKQH
ncbi:MAG: PEP-CTERM sorting domain-containing protein [Pirellulales bacterium]|nr:PEP-CTERM sorting domain-containing protein [Pirellulales bacterium]